MDDIEMALDILRGHPDELNFLRIKVADNDHRIRTEDGYEQLLWSHWLVRLGLTEKGTSGMLIFIPDIKKVG